jgi:hypothetical protein
MPGRAAASLSACRLQAQIPGLPAIDPWTPFNVEPLRCGLASKLGLTRATDVLSLKRQYSQLKT